MAKTPRRTGRREERKMIDALNKKRAFEEFEEEIWPMVRNDYRNGLSVAEIFAKYSRLAAIRTVTTIATEPDNAKALAAAKELLDRHIGKSVEKKEVEHRLGKLPEEQLDALLLTELSETAPQLQAPKRQKRTVKADEIIEEE